jgi:predicted O-linked N-acetylglucosamine transferase (SPINDLY family)
MVPIFLQQAAEHVANGRLAEAEAIYLLILRDAPRHPDATHYLGVVRRAQGHTDEGLDLIRRSLELAPNSAKYLGNFGTALMAQGELIAAIDAFKQSLALQQNAPLVHTNLGNALRLGGRLDPAIEHLETAIGLMPTLTAAHAGLGSALKDQGRLDQAIESLRRALALNPKAASIHSDLLYTMLFHEKYDSQEIFDAHLDWNRRHATHLAPRPNSHRNSRRPDRRLRVGYISSQFRDHAINFFIEPILAVHDRERIEVYCYADVAAPDAVTRRLALLADRWQSILGMSDEQVAKLIRCDEIDILLDPLGHTGGNRLLVFARKPAPVQASYIGYQATTGLTTMDYRLTDEWADPPGMTESFHSETLVRLMDALFCWQAPSEAVAASAPPCLASGYITFGSFNNFCKVRPHTLATWRSLLSSVPGSRLLILIPDSSCLRSQVSHELTRQGVDLCRIDFLDPAPRADYLAYYQRVDIALDPFPFNGHTTTCDALWMGVPVVAMCASEYRSRYGGSVLRNVGLSDLIARSPAEYVAIATSWAQDPVRLSKLRRSLRDRMGQSCLMDANGFTRKLEAAYREMWQRWCGHDGAN